MGSDASEVRAFAADLREVPARLIPRAAAAVKRGAVNIKDQLREEMSASRYFKGAARAITFDLDRSGLEAEIGPESGPGSPGALANIAYFGGSTGGGTVPDPQGALDREAPGFEWALLEAVDEALW